jgi:hypothetical protein
MEKQLPKIPPTSMVGDPNPKHHVRNFGPWRGALPSLGGHTNKKKKIIKLIISMFYRV